MIPTPSQPMKSWNRLLAEVRIIIVIKNSKRYLIKRFSWGSECIYQEENCIIDQVTYRATDINKIENRSILKLIVSFIELASIQCQEIIIYSVLRKVNVVSGIRLRKNEYFIDLVT